MNKGYIIIMQENNEYEYNGHLGQRQFRGIYEGVSALIRVR